MESSAISLCFSLSRWNPAAGTAKDATTSDGSNPSSDKNENEPSAATTQTYLINLIDSPGHIDFSSEVSTASRLCDGALVLVDAVEGVCSQTVTVLRQAWLEGRMKTLLVINKMDRLVTELRMTPAEAYAHLSRLLEQVNAVLGSFFQGERMEEDLNWRESIDERVRRANAKSEKASEGASDLSTRETSPHAKVAGYTDPTTSTEADVDDTTHHAQFEEKDDEDLYFSPEKNNVIFSSAIDGWAFTVRQFASLYEKKLGIRKAVMEKVLWGDHYLDPKTKKVLASKHLRGRNLKPMFVQLVLEPIWAVYQSTGGGEAGKGDSTMVEKITTSLNLTIPNHILRSRDPRAIQNTIFASWLPLSTAVLVSVIESLPSPLSAQAQRLPSILDATPGSAAIAPTIRTAMLAADPSREAPCIAYVSKMVSVKESELPEHRRGGSGRNGALSPEEARDLGRRKREEIAKMQAAERARHDQVGGAGMTLDPVGALAAAVDETTLTAKIDAALSGEKVPEKEQLIGFARVFSGTLQLGDSVFVILPKYDPSAPTSTQHAPQRVTITALYLLMGRGLEPLMCAPPGTVVGIGGLDGAIMKCGTISSLATGAPNLAGVTLAAPPIVRVALEPENPADLEKMVHGLRQLVRSDPCAQYKRLESGEHVLLTAGELHLERCLTDLRERFAGCNVQAGEPIVPYRETIVKAEEMRPAANRELGRGRVAATTASGSIEFTLAIRPLPEEVTDFLIKHSVMMQKLYEKSQAQAREDMSDSAGDSTVEKAIPEAQGDGSIANASTSMSLADFKSRLRELFGKTKTHHEMWTSLADRIVAFGPRRAGPNLLFDSTTDAICERYFKDAEGHAGEQNASQDSDQGHRHLLGDKISYAFQLATAQGPLCAEPVRGVAVVLEKVVSAPATDDGTSLHDNTGRLTGEILKTIQGAIKQGFLDWSPRLLLATYSCEVQASAEVLGRVYDVLTRRRGRVLSEALKEGTPFFTIQALLPVATSFGFSDEIRKRTSGAASPQLIFAGFQVLDEDPFWTPTTEEEMEDLGEKADRENVAKRWMDGVRTRKGLLVEGRKLVVDAEKQKTLKR